MMMAPAPDGFPRLIQDFFYVCLIHLKDRNFCTPKIDEEALKAKKERELAEEKEKVMKEYQEKQKKKKEKEEKAKNKDKDEKKEDEKDSKKEDKKKEDEEKPNEVWFGLHRFWRLF